MSYISGWVAKKLKSKVCEKCKNKLVSLEKSSSNDLKLLQNKQFKCLQPGQGLTIPSNNLRSLLYKSETIFQSVVEIQYRKHNVANQLFKIIKFKTKKLHAKLDCHKCQLIDSIIHLFVKCRLHFFLKQKIRLFSSYKAKILNKYKNIKNL